MQLCPSSKRTETLHALSAPAQYGGWPVRICESSSPTERTSLRRASGFTLLELLVVIVIIGLLAGYVAPRYFSQVGKSEVQVAKAQVDALEKALDQYRLDTRHYPTAEQGLQALMEK